MAQQIATAPLRTAVNLCEFCNQRPKSGTYRFCSKTCAEDSKPAHAAPASGSLCKNCLQRPRFGQFDYCGKACADQGASAPPSTPRRAKPPAATGRQTSRRPRDAAAISQALADILLPQVQATAILSTNAALKPFISALQSQGIGAIPQKNSPPANINPVAIVPTQECALLTCENQVYTDSNGVQTLFCSKKCTQAAVSSGLAQVCIMCKVQPQRGTDSFCSRACKESANGKVSSG